MNLAPTDKDEGAEIIKQAAAIASLLLQGGYGGADYILDALDRHATWEDAVTYVGYLSDTVNSAQWTIGEILYFMRWRYSHVTKKAFAYKDGDPLPDELYEYIQATFNRNLTALIADEGSKIVGWLGWMSYQFEDFWLLVGKGEVRVWAKTTQDTPTDKEWKASLAANLSPLIRELNHNTAWSYYAAVATFPNRDDRIPGVAWTAHVAARNAKADEVEGTLRGDERHAAIGKLAVPYLHDLHAEGNAKAPYIRNASAKNQREKAGFTWELPPIEFLYARDPETEEQVIAMDIFSYDFADYMLYHTKLSTLVHPGAVDVEYDDSDGKIFVDGHLVAQFVNREFPVVQAAMEIINKQRWNIRENL
jgi:hypothetical protein